MTEYYVYNSNGQRTRKITEDADRNIIADKLYFNGLEIKRDETGNIVEQNLHLHSNGHATVTARKPQKGTTQLRYQLGNHLGSVALELNEQALPLTYEEYLPYGGTAFMAATTQEEAIPKEHRYSGKERDDTSALCYYGARYYTPWLGRWLNPDPAGTVDGLNLYAFVRGNPIKHIDPYGYNSVDYGIGYGRYNKKQKEAAQKLVSYNKKLTVAKEQLQQLETTLIDIANHYKKKNLIYGGSLLIKSGVKTVAGLAGGAGGAIVGSVVPGPGTAIGGGVGAGAAAFGAGKAYDYVAGKANVRSLHFKTKDMIYELDNSDKGYLSKKFKMAYKDRFSTEATAGPGFVLGKAVKEVAGDSLTLSEGVAVPIPIPIGDIADLAKSIKTGHQGIGIQKAKKINAMLTHYEKELLSVDANSLFETTGSLYRRDPSGEGKGFVLSKGTFIPGLHAVNEDDILWESDIRRREGKIREHAHSIMDLLADGDLYKH